MFFINEKQQKTILNFSLDYNDAYVLVRGDITVIAALALNLSSIRLN